MKTPLVELYNQDTPQRLQHTFVFLEDNVKKHFMYLHSTMFAGEEEAYINFYNQERKLCRMHKKDTSYIFLETFLPSAGWYQAGKTAQYISARPQRQWKRSLCAATHKAVSPFHSMQISFDDFKNVEELTKEQKNISLDEAAALCKDHDVIRLSNSFAVCYNGPLYYNSFEVGKVSFEKHTFTINPMFRDEFYAIKGEGEWKEN